MKKYFKPVLLGLLAVLLVIQFIRPAKNHSDDQTNNIVKKYPIPETVQGILKKACYDCHSNYT